MPRNFRIAGFFVVLLTLAPACERTVDVPSQVDVPKGDGGPGAADAGTAGFPDAGPTTPDAGEREPEVVKQPDAGSPDAGGESSVVLEVAAGTADDQVAVEPGADDEPPRGPESFDIDADGNVHILDSPGAALKVFAPAGGLLRRIGLGPDGRSFLDFSVSPSGEVAVAHAPSHRLHVLPKSATDVAQAARQLGLPVIAGFDGVSFDSAGKLFVRMLGQWTYALDGDPGNPFLALLSMHSTGFFRVRRVSAALAVLFASDSYETDGISGNAKTVYEISPGIQIGSISFLDADSRGRVFVKIETVGELASGEVDVRRFVVRLGASDSDWSAPIEIPADVYALPFRDIRVGADGSVYAMLVYQDRVKVMRWTVD
ncbi:MAG: hypothetical protein HY897_04400 [Deltaproteobacteria bacterium]|nr:hypothetical protein [Deltaproteobacteria bacterium]